MYTDLVFKVGPELFPIEAHRIILATVSETFQTLLYGGINEDNSTPKHEIIVPEFNVPAFEAFVKVL
jgi:hypothetical protein